VVRTLVEEVGAEKLMWGSDMSACERTVTYSQSMLLFQSRCDFLTAEQRAAILGGNLERLYKV
jgi:predicted TIM-barrel fold metal-dependent hydrolase